MKNICRGYIAFEITQMVEMVKWQAQYIQTQNVEVWSYGLAYSLHNVDNSPWKLATFKLDITVIYVGRAGPSRCRAQCKTWAQGPMQDLSAEPLWTVILWRHRVQSTVLNSWQSANLQYSTNTRIEHVC